VFEKILIPVDGSPFSKCAVAMAAELARCHGSSVYLLHVIRSLTLPKEIMAMIRSGEITESSIEILQDSADIILENAERELGEQGITGIERACLVGDPPSKILEYASDKGVDLIVLGHRGLGPTQGLLGGVARKLVNMTEISCLIATCPEQENS
jgi:nucleotide-binding universal stress UspA family protein